KSVDKGLSYIYHILHAFQRKGNYFALIIYLFSMTQSFDSIMDRHHCVKRIFLFLMIVKIDMDAFCLDLWHSYIKCILKISEIIGD
ncbi:MAG TPA: hypothetical protein PLR24_09350, partial [Saprospiraceae bacterium]|nr:hypothetical protein [Saprospiraceae bacterium]